MSLLNTSKPASQTAENKPAAASTEGAKKHSNSEYQKRVREQTRANGKIVKDFIATLKDVPENVKAAADWLGREPGSIRASSGSTFGKPVFYKIFGNTPKVGDKIKASEVFDKFDKGYSDMRKYFKQWKEKMNVVVELDGATKTYIIKEAKDGIPAYTGND